MNRKEFIEFIKNVPVTQGATYEARPYWPNFYYAVCRAVPSDEKIIKLVSQYPNRYNRLVECVQIGSAIFHNNQTVEGIVLPRYLLGINELQFWGCTHLKWVWIPKTVKRIPEGAFRDCISLTDLYYEGTLEQWKEIEIIHERKEIEFGKLIPGSPVQSIMDERIVPIPGNEALLLATIHFNVEEDFNR